MSEESLQGEVLRITYRSDANDWSVLKLKVSGMREEQTLVGVTLAPDLTQEQFDALDADHDGRLSPEELGGASPGCHCSGAKSLGDWRHRAGDLFLIGLGLLSQALLSRVPRKF